MSNQPEALRLADHLESRGLLEEAAELRRLHQFAEDQIGRATAAEAALQMTKATHALKLSAVEAQRDALLEALKAMLENGADYTATRDQARAAIAKAEEQT